MRYLHVSPKIVSAVLAGMFSGALLFSCSEPAEKRARADRSVTASVEKEKECIVWSHEDSAAMEVVHIANAYIFNGHREKAGVLFRHAATLPHDLPGIALNAGMLTKDSLEAETYYRMEIRQDRRVLQSDLPDCRKYEFLVTMYRCYRLLNEPHKADSILKHYRRINKQATPSGKTMRGAWAIF